MSELALVTGKQACSMVVVPDDEPVRRCGALAFWKATFFTLEDYVLCPAHKIEAKKIWASPVVPFACNEPWCSNVAVEYDALRDWYVCFDHRNRVQYSEEVAETLAPMARSNRGAVTRSLTLADDLPGISRG